MKSLTPQPLTVFVVLIALTFCQIFNGTSSLTIFILFYELNQIYLSYSEESPDSFTTGQIQHFWPIHKIAFFLCYLLKRKFLRTAFENSKTCKKFRLNFKQKKKLNIPF